MWTREEIRQHVAEAFKPDPPPLTPAQRSAAKALAEREQLANGSGKPTAAIAQDVARSSDALTERLRDERGRTFSDKETAQRQALLDIAYSATLALHREIVLVPYHRRSATVGPNDSDANLHVSPEDQTWGKMK